MSSDLPRTTLEQWATLQAVVDHGGFERAAEALSRSQSAVSYSLKRLQEQLPVAVLVPQGRRTQLTDPGAVLLQRARLMLDEARRLEQLAATLAQGWETEVRLAVEIVMPPDPLLGALARFSAQAPQTRVQMMETVLSGTGEALLQQQADLAITGLVPPGFLGDPLVRVDFIAVARSDHPLHRLGRTLTLEDLRAHRQVVIRDTGRFRQLDSGWLDADERWTVSHLLTAIAIIKRGLAFAWMPRPHIQAELESGELRPLPLEQGAIRPETLYLVYADPVGAGPATRALGRLLAAESQSWLAV
ncbi:LysR family transcriptional regulator [Thiobaca trueperi]|uniref:DNA-binding transcriptional LysR family regulator n=1 Tax=Thiobaca trueperi TaxID=127458 RepID=A0A4V2V1Q9_9GAMM|nr:LysR family transcriptional regulator [Thiobaca trueperi]TCT22142.1 DNA-binding transcriptional LysR family regulator [Thiobaca trueperi]